MFLFTHDIDWLNPHHPVSIFKTVIGKKWLSPAQLVKSDILLKNAEKLFDLEKRNDICALNLIGIQSRKNTYRRLGIRYSNDSVYLKEFISLCKSYGQPLGLHVNHLESINYQCEHFEKLTGSKPLYIRSHYFMKMSHERLTELQRMGVKYDLSKGASYTIGILNTDKSNPLLNIPTVISDNHFVRMQNDNQVYTQFNECLLQLKQSPQDVSVLFHPENFIAYPRLTTLYEQLIDTIKKSGIGISRPKHV